MKTHPSYNPWLLAASALMFLTFLIHFIAGGIDIYIPLRESELALEPKSTLSVVWHTISAFLLLFGGALLWMSRNNNPPLACFVGLCQLCFALIFMGYGLYDAGSLMTMPQWTIFALCALLMWFGHKRAA